MSAKSRQGERQLTLPVREENIVESRPITPPCRKVVGGPVSNGLLLLPPDSDNIQFNSTASIATQTKKRYGSADRIQRKLCTVERSNSAGGRLIDERNVDHSGILEESQNHEPVQTELKTSQPSQKKADVKPGSISQELKNGKSHETVNDINNCLDNLHVNEDLPIELKAEFLSCVMEKNYEKALHLCNEMLAFDPENITAVEFQIVIKEKLQQESSSDDDSEEDESETDESEADDVDNNSDESADSDNEDDEDGDEDEENEEDNQDSDESSDDEEEEESDSDSDIEIPTGPINLLMGGLPLRPSSAPPDDRLRKT